METDDPRIRKWQAVERFASQCVRDDLNGIDFSLEDLERELIKAGISVNKGADKQLFIKSPLKMLQNPTTPEVWKGRAKILLGLVHLETQFRRQRHKFFTGNSKVKIKVRKPKHLKIRLSKGANSTQSSGASKKEISTPKHSYEAQGAPESTTQDNRPCTQRSNGPPASKSQADRDGDPKFGTPPNQEAAADRSDVSQMGEVTPGTESTRSSLLGKRAQEEGPMRVDSAAKRSVIGEDIPERSVAPNLYTKSSAKGRSVSTPGPRWPRLMVDYMVAMFQRSLGFPTTPAKPALLLRSSGPPPSLDPPPALEPSPALEQPPSIEHPPSKSSGQHQDAKSGCKEARGRMAAPPSCAQEAYYSIDNDDHKKDSSSLAAAVSRAANRSGRSTPPTLVGKPGSGSACAQFNQQVAGGFDGFDPRGADFKPAPPAPAHTDFFSAPPAAPVSKPAGVGDLFGDASLQSTPATVAPAAALAQDFFGGGFSAPASQATNNFLAAPAKPAPAGPAHDAFRNFASVPAPNPAAPTGFDAFGAPPSNGFAAPSSNGFGVQAPPKPAPTAGGFDSFGDNDFGAFGSGPPSASKPAPTPPAPARLSSQNKHTSREPPPALELPRASTSPRRQSSFALGPNISQYSLPNGRVFEHSKDSLEAINRELDAIQCSPMRSFTPTALAADWERADTKIEGEDDPAPRGLQWRATALGTTKREFDKALFDAYFKEECEAALLRGRENRELQAPKTGAQDRGGCGNEAGDFARLKEEPRLGKKQQQGMHRIEEPRERKLHETESEEASDANETGRPKPEDTCYLQEQLSVELEREGGYSDRTAMEVDPAVSQSAQAGAGGVSREGVGKKSAAEQAAAMRRNPERKARKAWK